MISFLPQRLHIPRNRHRFLISSHIRTHSRENVQIGLPFIRVIHVNIEAKILNRQQRNLEVSRTAVVVFIVRVGFGQMIQKRSLMFKKRVKKGQKSPKMYLFEPENSELTCLGPKMTSNNLKLPQITSKSLQITFC